MISKWVAPMVQVVSPKMLPPQPATRRVKVLHVITNFTTGAGGNTFLSAVGMDSMKYESWVAGAPGGEFWDRAEQMGVRTVKLPRFRRDISPVDDLVVLGQLISLIRRERFTIVHTHTAKAGLLGRLAATLCGAPVVVHTYHAFSFHEFMNRRTRSGYLLLERLVRPMTDQFVAVSPLVAREAVEYRVAAPGNITTAPSAVELDELPAGPDPSVRHEFGIPLTAPLIGTVGRISFQKAPLDFVRMAASISRSRPNARFMMVGDGPLIDEVEAEARRLGVEVLVPGFRTDAVRIASAFDVFVMPSLYEGLGRALTEALALGRPVVASAVNGVADLVRPGATGLLCPPADPESAAACVLWLLDHPTEAERMAQQGQSAVRSLFDAETMCSVLDATYGRLLGAPVEIAPRQEPNAHEQLIALDDSAFDLTTARNGDGAGSAAPAAHGR